MWSNVPVRASHQTWLRFLAQVIDDPCRDTVADRFSLVPMGRLELPRLSPLPPQDSVSTNFTTSALTETRRESNAPVIQLELLRHLSCLGTISRGGSRRWRTGLLLDWLTQNGAAPLAAFA